MPPTLKNGHFGEFYSENAKADSDKNEGKADEDWYLVQVLALVMVTR